MDIDLRINSIRFALGERMDCEKLKSAESRKAGFVTRTLCRVPRGHVLYWAKNCTVHCFGDEFEVSAILGTKFPRIMCGTSAYVFYAPTGVHKIVFQVIKSHRMAIRSAKSFTMIAKERLGEASSADERITMWEDSESVLVCELHTSSINAYFRWMTKSHPSTL